MKKIKYILLITLALYPTYVYAITNEVSSGISILSALFMEAFITIHMSIFVFKPIADIYDPNKTKSLFLKLSIIRAIILLTFDISGVPEIAIIDFFAVFIGAFIFIPRMIAKNGNKTITNNTNINSQESSDKQNNYTVLKCPKCGNVISAGDKKCPKCGMILNDNNIIKETNQLVIPDQNYLIGEKEILKNILLEELNNQGENEKTLITTSLNKKENIILIIFGLITIICCLMYYFNYSLYMCFFIESIAFLSYIIIKRHFSIMNLLMKQAIKNPDENISNIVNNAKNEKYISSISSSLKFIIVLIICTLLPTLFFIKPRLIYAKYEDGYSITRYTRGIIKREKNIVIPDQFRGKKILAIGESAFANTDIESIELPIGLETIKTKAFYNCYYLKKIDIPYTVQEIRGSAFENNINLKTIILHDGLKEIRGSAFKNNTYLSEINLPDSLEYLGGSAFSNCKSLISIKIPKKVTEINGQTFEYCTSLRQVDLHDDIISIHGETFIGDENLESIILPAKITEVRGSTFEGCSSLTSIIIPEGVTRIGGHAFHGCTNLSSVSIPSTILEIGSSAFRQCYSLQTVRVPYRTVINERAFKESPTYVERY